jgi:hypothetical protein
MPCIYEPSSEEIRQPDKDKIDSLTRMLCAILSALHNRYGDALEVVTDLSKADEQEIQIWWSEHQERDRQRRIEVQKRALAKLTDEEKKALGL